MPFSFKKNLVVQIGVWVTLFSLFSVFIISLFTYTFSRNTLREGVLSEVDNISSGLEVTLDHWLEEQQQDFRSLTTDGFFIEQVLDLLENRKEISTTSRSYHFIDRQLQGLIASNSDFREILILSRRGGEVLLSTTREHEGSFQQDSRFFVEGLKESSVLPVYYWPQTLDPTMTLSFPVWDAQGESIGVIAVHLNLKHVLENLSAYPTIARIGITYLVDANHVPVGASRSAIESFPRGLHSKGIDAALAGQNGVDVYTDFLGEEVVGGYRWLDNFGFALIAEIPFNKALEPAGSLGMTIFAIGCIGTLILSGGLILLSRRIVRPILAVSHAAKEVSSGNLDVEPVRAGTAEIGVLVESFNTMVKQIHDLLEDVRDREERYRTVFNASGEAIFIHDSESSKVLDFNLAAQRIFGLEEGEVIDDVAEISAGYPPYSTEDVLGKIALVRDQGTQVFEWRSRRKNGELFWTEVSLSKMEVVGKLRYLAVVRDIDQRKQNDAELEEYRKNLEWTIEDRTRQLHEAQDALVNQERLAVLGQLTATVSHELRNPLGTMSNALFSLEAAIETGALDKVGRPLELLDRNIRRCDKIIGELLDFTRRHEIDKEKTDLDRWLGELLDEYLLAEGISLERELISNASVFIDRESIRRAIINLLDNSVQAMQDAGSYGKLLTVKSFIKEDTVEVRVIDQGPGIPEENRSTIFEPLFSTKEFGVGLGVPIISNIMQRHEGRLDYYCPPDGGTVAVLTLPLSAGGNEDEE